MQRGRGSIILSRLRTSIIIEPKLLYVEPWTVRTLITLFVMTALMHSFSASPLPLWAATMYCSLRTS